MVFSKLRNALLWADAVKFIRVNRAPQKNVLLLKFFAVVKIMEVLSNENCHFSRNFGAPDALVVDHLGEMRYEGRDILLQEMLTCTLRDIFLSIEGSSCSAWLVITLANDILRGLAHIHNNGIVHADLKPMNLMWDAKTSTFKIIDFGLSFRTTEQYTHAIQSKGYQAPECMRWNSFSVAQRFKAVETPGPPADVWSAGCIIIEAMTGSQFSYGDGENTEETLRARVEAMSCSYSGPFIVEAQRFLIRCLQVSPRRRPGADELLGDPWLKQYHQPLFTDTVLLPTTVIRILNAEDPGVADSGITKDTIECRILNLCKKYGETRGHHFEAALGHFYVCYQEPSEAEAAQQALTKCLINDRMIIDFLFIFFLDKKRFLLDIYEYMNAKHFYCSILCNVQILFIIVIDMPILVQLII
ncbi:serine/threonine-protein kinase Kist-like [Macrobrachium nipponense]|uniref:serine/threonine-protein kinase Kist-like n=1 Tax=Macrobrachium nipponense TaxID=159736 RepID=UPI0030C8D3EE